VGATSVPSRSGGFSGLAAAHFFLKEKPKARILILDNHDDFGGHARRNEFQVGGRTLIGYGGNQTLEAPSGYPDLVKGLLRDLGVDIKRFDTAYDQEFYKRNGLGPGIHFNRENWGVDRIVPFDLGPLSYLPLAPSALSPREAVAQMPISEPARHEFMRLLSTHQDQIPEIPTNAKAEYLYTSCRISRLTPVWASRPPRHLTPSTTRACRAGMPQGCLIPGNQSLTSTTFPTATLRSLVYWCAG